MLTFLIIIALIFLASLSLKYAALVICIALVVGFVVKFISSVVGQEVSLLNSIQAVLLSVFLTVLAMFFSVQNLPDLVHNSIFIFIISLLLIVFASSFAFSFCLGLSMKSATIVNVIFWGMAYSLLMYFGVAIFKVAA